MQQIIPPVAAIQMQGKSVEDRIGATYTLAKLSLAEACRIASIARRIKEVAAARDAEESRIEKERELWVTTFRSFTPIVLGDNFLRHVLFNVSREELLDMLFISKVIQYVLCLFLGYIFWTP